MLSCSLLRISVVCASLTALSYGVSDAQTAPAPPPASTTNDRAGGAPGPAALATPVPGASFLHVKGLTISGALRAYDLTRLNLPEYNAKAAPTGPDRTAFNFGGDIRADYKLGNTPFSVGGAFWGAYPFGINGGSVRCNVGGGQIVHEPQALCAKNSAGFDNSLPGYPLGTFEYYVKYADSTASIAVGNQLLNKLWLPASDSRIKPALYQGLDATFNLTKALSLGFTRITRFENRTESTFDQCTLLTCTTTPAGVGGAGSLRGVSLFSTKTPITTGADRLGLAFKPSSRFSVTTEVYRFHNIANLTYLDSRYYALAKNAYNPYFGVQFVSERQAGNAIVGRVENQTIGLQLGVNPVKNLVFSVGADYAPWNYDTVTASSAAAAAGSYFQPAGGTNQLVTAAGVNGSTANVLKVAGIPNEYRVAYGGIASPYTDSYVSDPLYTSSISQGMADRRSAGFALKGTLTYTSTSKRIVAIASEAAYNYDTDFARNRTYELDADVTYNFNPVRAGTYRGLSFRERFADRTQPTLPYNFIYIRHQLQYNF